MWILFRWTDSEYVYCTGCNKEENVPPWTVFLTEVENNLPTVRVLNHLQVGWVDSSGGLLLNQGNMHKMEDSRTSLVNLSLFLTLMNTAVLSAITEETQKKKILQMKG